MLRRLARDYKRTTANEAIIYWVTIFHRDQAPAHQTGQSAAKRRGG